MSSPASVETFMVAALTPLPWTADMATGIKAIDVEHQTLVVLYNDLLHALDRPISATMRREFYDTLCNHLRHHLAHEEAVLTARGYSNTTAHADAHRRGEAALRALAEPADSPESLVPLARFLREWIISHILGEDRAAFAALA